MHTIERVTGSIAARVPLSSARVVEALEEARRRTFALVESVSDDDLERVHSPLMSPLVWDLAHIAAYEDLWLVHRYGERPLLHDDLAAMYDAFETPRAVRGDLPLLGPSEAREYLEEVRARTLEVIDERGVGDGTLHEMVLRHEHQHDETMLQTLMLARLPGYELPGRRPIPDPAHPSDTGLEMVEVTAGECTIGASDEGFAYDNERPRHRTDVRGYLIGRTPITNATYLTFVEGGGYEHRDWWSEEGWAWKEEYDISRPASVDGGPPRRVATRRTRTTAPGATRRSRVLVRGRRLCPRSRRPPPHRDRVGEGGDLGRGNGSRPPPRSALSVGQPAAGCRPARQPRPPRLRNRPPPAPTPTARRLTGAWE